MKTKFCVNENCYLEKGKEVLWLLKANYKWSYYSWYSWKLTDQKTKTQTDFFRMLNFFYSISKIKMISRILRGKNKKKLIYGFKSSYKDSKCWFFFLLFYQLANINIFLSNNQIQIHSLILENQIITLLCKLFILIVYTPHTA